MGEGPLLDHANYSSTNNRSLPDIFCSHMLAASLVWSVCGITCACIGTPACIWVLRILIIRQRGGLTNDAYMFSLTIMDLLLNVLLFPTIFNYLIIKSEMFVSIGGYFVLLNLCGRPLMMVFMCVDCYMAVVWPITYMRIKDKPYRLVVSVLVWTWSWTFSFILILCHRSTQELMLILYPLCLLFIAFCDVSILRTLKKPDPSGKTDVHPQKKRAQQTIINSLVMSLVSYLPTVVLQGLSLLLPLGWQEIYCTILVLSYINPCLGSAIMPLLIVWNLKDNVIGG